MKMANLHTLVFFFFCVQIAPLDDADRRVTTMKRTPTIVVQRDLRKFIGKLRRQSHSFPISQWRPFANFAFIAFFVILIQKIRKLVFFLFFHARSVGVIKLSAHCFIVINYTAVTATLSLICYDS